MTETPATSSGDETSAAPVTAVSRGAVVGLVVTALVAALLAAVIVAGQLWLHGKRVDDARRVAVRQAAVTAAGKVLSYDYRHLQADIDAATPLITGDFKTQYLALRQALLQTAPAIQAVVTANVQEVTVLDASSGSARVLLFVDQTNTSTKLTAPQVDQSRVVLTMTRSGGHWLVNALSAV